MAVHNSALRLKRPVENITPDVKHLSFLVLTREKVIEDVMRAVWPFIECVVHRQGLGYVCLVHGVVQESSVSYIDRWSTLTGYFVRWSRGCRTAAARL